MDSCPHCGYGLSRPIGSFCPSCGGRLTGQSAGDGAYYTGPQPFEEVGAQGFEVVPGQFSTRAALSQGWEVLSRHYGILLLAILVFLGIQIALQLFSLIPIVGPILALLVSAPLSAGFSYMGVIAFRTHRLSVGDLFYGFQRFWAMVGMMLLKALISIGCIAPFAAVVGIAAVVSRGQEEVVLLVAILALVIGLPLLIWLTVRLLFSEVICLETGFGIIDSLKRSWEITRNDFWGLLWLGIVVTVIVAATALACLLPMFFLGLPLGMGVFGAAYCLIAPSPPVPQQRGFEPLYS